MSTASDSLNPKSKEYQRYLSIRAEINKMSSKPISKTVTPSVIKISKPISIIIYAYQISDYIEECLNSIEKQTYFVNNDNYEVLIGVDNCEETLLKIYEIKNKYRNIKIHEMSEHRGTFVTFNTLLDLVSYENILHFYGDDIMKPEMIEEILQYTKEYDIVKFEYQDFDEDITNLVENKFWFNDGVFLFNKYVLNLVGGYRNWMYAADIELFSRVHNFVSIKKLDKILFYKRQHDYDFKINKNDQLKIAYDHVIKNYENDKFSDSIKIEKTSTLYVEKSSPVINKNFVISFIIPIRDRDDQILGCEYNINHFFEDYKYEILYVNQHDKKLFKRGQLCNIGFRECIGDIIIFQDVDIRHFRKFNPQELLEKFKGPFVAFNSVTHIYENQLGKYETIKNESTPEGWGACTVFYRRQFIECGGFSNLVFGWGAEDNVINERAHFKKHMQDIGHVYHEREKKGRPEYYKNNVEIWRSENKRSSLKDGFQQTTYNLVSKIQKFTNVYTLNVNNIGVISSFEYMKEYTKYSAQDPKDETKKRGNQDELVENLVERCNDEYPSPTPIERLTEHAIQNAKTPEVKYVRQKKDHIKVLLAPDIPNWAFDNISNAIIKYNPYPDKISYEKIFIIDRRKITSYEPWDYVYVFFEAERWLPFDKHKMIRGCYASLWLEHDSYTPEYFGDLFSKCRAVIFVNDNLKTIISPYLTSDIDYTIINDSSDETMFYPTDDPKYKEFTAIFVGNTERKVKNFPEIQKICNQAGIKLVVAQNIPYHKLVNEYNKSDICINFSTAEGGPQTFVEAALCGIPMIIRDHIALTKIIPSFTGKTTDDFVKTLLHLKEHREECVKMGKKAQRAALEHLTYRKTAAKFANFFLKLNTKDNG